MVPDARRLCTHGRRDLALGVGRLGAGQCNASSSARLSGGRPRPHAWRSAPAPRGPSRERALAPSPRGIASVGGPSPWTSDGRGLPARAVRTLDPGRTCSRERSCPMPSSAAGQGRALRARGGYSRSARWPPPFTPTRNRRCHASAVRRRPPRRWPEFLHETLPSRREIARLARRLEPQGIEAISVRGHRLCLRRHGRQQLVSIQCPRTPGRRLPDARCLKPEASGATAGSSTSDSGGRRPAITRGDARTHLRDSLDRHESGSGRGRLLNRRFRGAAALGGIESR
jgi:hypothetical protein